MTLFNRFAPAMLCLAVLSLALFLCCSPTCGLPGRGGVVAERLEDAQLIAAVRYKRLRCGGKYKSYSDVYCYFYLDASLGSNTQGYVTKGTLYKDANLKFMNRKTGPTIKYLKGTEVTFNSDGSVATSSPGTQGTSGPVKPPPTKVIDLSGSQTRGTPATNAKIDCKGITLPNGGRITSVTGGYKGFYLSTNEPWKYNPPTPYKPGDPTSVPFYNPPGTAVGIVLNPGVTYYVWPELADGKRYDSVTIHVKPNPEP